MLPEKTAPHTDSDTQSAAGISGGEAGTVGKAAWREVEALANAVRTLHHQENRGDLAALRRMETESPTEPAFHRILARIAPEAYREHAGRLALLTKILALATSAEVLRSGRQSLGEALYAADVSEARVQMLMTARGSALDDLLLRTARRLVREGLLPYQDLGKLVLGSPKTVEDTRFRTARGYWARRSPTARDEGFAVEPVAGEDE